MKLLQSVSQSMLALALAWATTASAGEASKEPFKPVSGQAGKDVVWVPTPDTLVQHMLDLAKVTPRDFVMDLGSGDGRNIIAAAKRGARALGIEYNPDMVELSRRAAEKEGVAGRARFEQGDMYAADVSQASVLALFLLTDNMNRMVDKFLAMKPGSRIVSNTYEITGWAPDETSRLSGDCMTWCTALLYIVPTKVTGTWQLGKGELKLEQSFQMLKGTLSVNGESKPIAAGKLRGEQIVFTVDGTEYVGHVNGDSMSGKVKGTTSGAWSAKRL